MECATVPVQRDVMISSGTFRDGNKIGNKIFLLDSSFHNRLCYAYVSFLQAASVRVDHEVRLV